MKLNPMKIQSKVTIKGDRTGGFILEVQDSMGFKGDIALTMVELDIIYQILTKKFEKNTIEKRNKSDEKKRVQTDFKPFIKSIKKAYPFKEVKAPKEKVAKSVKKRVR